jgi:sulfhydrogenase subunit gamma (sulfur reductase)
MVPQHSDRPNFIAGQIAVLEMGDYKPTTIAFASAPEDAEYEFLIKRSRSLNVTGALFDPHIAKHVVLTDIIGRGFPVEEYQGHDLVFVAMGTGLAPLRSVLRHIFYSRADYGRLVVLYGVRTLEDCCFAQEMSSEWLEQGIELRQVISQPGESDWSGPTGYVQSLLDNLVPTMDSPVALISGSSEMVGQTRERLFDLGFTPEKILTNY